MSSSAAWMTLPAWTQFRSKQHAYRIETVCSRSCGSRVSTRERSSEVGIEVPYSDGAPEKLADELLAHAETVIMSIGAPFVPIKHEGTIYIRPPVS